MPALLLPEGTGEKHGYRHRITFLKGRKESASELLPRRSSVVVAAPLWGRFVRML
jgi:hypothetical protein